MAQNDEAPRGGQNIVQAIWTMADQMNAEAQQADDLLSDNLADLPLEFDDAFFEERRKSLLSYLSAEGGGPIDTAHPLVAVTGKGICVLAENLLRLREMFDSRAASMGYRGGLAQPVPPPAPTMWLPMACDSVKKNALEHHSDARATIVRLNFVPGVDAPMAAPDVAMIVDGKDVPVSVLNYDAEFREMNVVVDRDMAPYSFEVISSEDARTVKIEVVTDRVLPA